APRRLGQGVSRPALAAAPGACAARPPAARRPRAGRARDRRRADRAGPRPRHLELSHCRPRHGRQRARPHRRGSRRPVRGTTRRRPDRRAALREPRLCARSGTRSQRDDSASGGDADDVGARCARCARARPGASARNAELGRGRRRVPHPVAGARRVSDRRRGGLVGNATRRRDVQSGDPSRRRPRDTGQGMRARSRSPRFSRRALRADPSRPDAGDSRGDARGGARLCAPLLCAILARLARRRGEALKRVHERRRQRDPEPGQFLQRIVAALCLLLVPHIPTKAESTRILDEMYATANARLSRGDAAGAAEGFRVVAEATPELPETNAAAALAIALADWQRQDEAVPYVRRALAAEPANPIAAIVAVIADPAHSVLRDDDALYLTPRASERLAAAAELLASPYPGLRTAPLLLVRFARSGETTGDPYFPQRILGFRSLARAASFAAMFVVDVPASRFAVYD